MKKKTRRQLDQDWRQGFRRHTRSLARSGKLPTSISERGTDSLFPGRIYIRAPVTISIYEYSKTDGECFSHTMDFIDEIGKRFGKKSTVIDFRATERFSAAAMIVVYAAFEHAKTNGDQPSVLLWSKGSPAVNRALKLTNLYKLISGKPIKYSFGDGRDIPVVSSVGATYMEDIVDYIQRRVYDDMTPETEYYYGDAVSETINNVGLHAYPGVAKEERKWWLLCDVIGDQLYLGIYDSGVGIPKTIVEKSWIWPSMSTSFPKDYDRLLDGVPAAERSGLDAYLRRKVPDQHLIYLSMEGDVTGTKKSKHGQGSKSIKKLVSETDDGKLWVFSNNGLYIYQGDGESHEIISMGKKFPGTLIQWNIKIT